MLDLWSDVAQTLGVQLQRTTAFHPQASGLCVRFHHSLKTALRAILKITDRLSDCPGPC